MKTENITVKHRAFVVLIYELLFMLVPIEVLYWLMRRALGADFPHRFSVYYYLTVFFIFAEMTRRYFDVTYIFTQNGAIQVEGRLSLHLHKVSLKYSDIREVRLNQSLIGRILGFGTIELGTASTNGYEISMRDISAPKQLIEFISQRCSDIHRGKDSDKLRKLKVVEA
ncbi:MAG: PH domain-containing protein [Deltaproteobacteria bacterium]|nr:PH domain-containing protein [Deltaproteobacteria bacterium]